MATRGIPVVPTPGEEWRTIRAFPDYMVSNLGRVARKAGAPRTSYDRIVEGSVKDTGYRQVMLTRGNKLHGRKVHQIVADEFIRTRVLGDVVNHIDGNKLNNHLSNLEITDHAGNTAHAVAHGLIRRGARHHATKLTDADVRDIRARFAAGEPGQSIADAYGIGRSYAYQIKRGEERPA